MRFGLLEITLFLECDPYRQQMGFFGKIEPRLLLL
jgi:hypothetical protein